MSLTFANDFIHYLYERYPSTKSRSLLINENMISPFVLPLKDKHVDEARATAASTFALRQLPQYQQQVRDSQVHLSAKFDPGNFSAFMSYDFHLTADGLKLIEINTNAAFSMVAYELHLFNKLETGLHTGYREKLKATFESELEACVGRPEPKAVAIVDDEPDQQKMFFEFVMIADMFTSWGWETEILDAKDLKFSGGKLTGPSGRVFDLVYYRSTDFFLEGSSAIRDAYLARAACITPNPHEYAMLADKARLIDMTDSQRLAEFGLPAADAKVLSQRLPFIYDTKKFTPEQLWDMRKKVVFKPKHAYAGKEVYRGANITRKVFEHVCDGDFVAQEFIPAPEIELKLPSGSAQEFKYDLRFYAYRDEIQLATARLYQGQVTNFRSPGSGFTAIEIV
ncbi:MAG: hypothetical protein ABL958_00445 [Bdellovibrionia bacterium]